MLDTTQLFPSLQAELTDSLRNAELRLDRQTAALAALRKANAKFESELGFARLVTELYLATGDLLVGMLLPELLPRVRLVAAALNLGNTLVESGQRRVLATKAEIEILRFLID